MDAFRIRDRNPGKKQLSVKNLALFNSIIRVVANATGKNESEVVEETMYMRYLPEEENIAASVACNLFNGSSKDIQDCLFSVFCQFSAIPQKADETSINLLRYVLMMEARKPTAITGEEEEVPHLLSSLRQVIDHLESVGADSIHVMSLKYAIDEIRDPNGYKGRQFLEILTVLNVCWDLKGKDHNAIYHSTHVYRVLGDMAKIAKWENNDANKYDLIYALKKVKVKEI